MPPTPPTLSARNLTKAVDSKRLFTGISLTVEDGERVALIGPNGSGKSTLLKILARADEPDEGEITRRKGLRTSYVPQSESFDDSATALSVVTDSALAARLPHIHDRHEAELAAELLLARLGPLDAAARCGTLSGGQKKRLAIACGLVQEPHLLLLDEPTNHLDVMGIEWLGEMLRTAPCACVFVTHDRTFLEETATRIVELSQAYAEGTFSVTGDYTAFLRRKTEFLEGQARQEQALAGLVREDLRWLARGAKARRTKSKSRAAAAHERIGELSDLKARNSPARAAAIDFAGTERQTQKLLWARGLRKAFGERLLFSGVEVRLGPGTTLALMGPNGCGKSTLIGLLTGAITPDTPTQRERDEDERDRATRPRGAAALGTVDKASNLRIVVFSQHRTELDPDQTLGSALSPVDAVIYRGRSMHIVGWAQRFLFTRDQLQGPVRSLSGGERARVHIARLMLEPADVLVLDEPTNDLDIPSLEVLEESLEDFPGAIVLVSHDRAMVARLATEIIGLDGRGGARSFAEYDQWEAWTRSTAEAREAGADRPQGVARVDSATDAAESTASRRKLSYKEQQELARIEPEIHAAEERVKTLEAAMNDPAVIADHRQYAAVCEELGALQERVGVLFDRWAELDSRA
ncbi:MAG: ABC-F family ATP-binding cassette domain-containing protein [Phycisphaerales bacterium]